MGEDVHPYTKVLILILLEDGFWLPRNQPKNGIRPVLILILLEDGFWFQSQPRVNFGWYVLILILLEDGFWLTRPFIIINANMS